MRKSDMKASKLLIIVLVTCTFLISSCEEYKEDSSVLPSGIEVIANFGDSDGTTPFYIYGSRNIDFSVRLNKGNVELVQFFYQGVELESFSSQSGSFYFTPDMSKEEGTDLEMKVTVVVDQNIYYETIPHKIHPIKISAEDFELKETTINSFVFKMIGKRLNNYKYILNGKALEDLDNITVQRKFAQFSFPTESDIDIFLVPKEHEYTGTQSYPYVKLNIKDEKLGDFHMGSTLSHYMCFANKELYVWSLDELSIFNKDMNEIKNQKIENINNIFVTPKTGLVVVNLLFKDIITYSDNSLSTIISTIDPQMRLGKLQVNEKDQLFNGHNSTIDVYDLHTGNLIYSLQFEDYLNDYTISEGKLFVKLGNNYNSTNQLYQLNDKSATYLYSLKKNYMNCIAHPINHNHIILDDTYNGFEIFDIESRTSLLSFKGQFQSIDPITGSLLYYDERYGYENNNTYDNHVVDLDYNKILTFEDASQSTYGAFLQFNNYIIKSDRYVNLLPKR